MEKPTLGRINPAIGRIVHYRSHVVNVPCAPAIITRVWSTSGVAGDEDTPVNLRVFDDLAMTVVSSVQQGKDTRHWHTFEDCPFR